MQTSDPSSFYIPSFKSILTWKIFEVIHTIANFYL